MGFEIQFAHLQTLLWVSAFLTVTPSLNDYYYHFLPSLFSLWLSQTHLSMCNFWYLLVSWVFGPLCCMFCRGFGGSNCGLGVGWLGHFGGAVWLCLLLALPAPGDDVEAVFCSALSLDLLPNRLDVEWSTCWTGLLVADVRGWGRALWYYSQYLWSLVVFAHRNDCTILIESTS